MKRRPNSPFARQPIADAARLWESGRYAEAEEKCREILGSAPDNADALGLLGVILGQRGAIDEAVELLERSIAIAPKLGTWMNLGVLTLASNPARAEECFRRALSIDANCIPARGNLATIYLESNRFDDAEKELSAIVSRAPNDTAALRLLARIAREKTNFGREVELLHKLVRLEPRDASLPKLLSKAYFLWYDSVDKEHDKAIAVLEKWLKFEPDSPVARHMHASLTGQGAPIQAAAAYVERHFDEFAPQFDAVLAKLDYRGPELVCEALTKVAPLARKSVDVADIGCGTGRLGELVAPWKLTLTGVDLSSKMLDEAAKRGTYDSLVRADAAAFLRENKKAFDVIACVDTLIYFGDIGPLFEAAFDSLRARGRFVGTVEVLDEQATAPFRLHEGGRYAHRESYLTTRLAAAGFVLEALAPAALRNEFERPVAGLVFVARRSA